MKIKKTKNKDYKKIFNKVDISALNAYLLEEIETDKLKGTPYGQTISLSEKPFLDRLEQTFSGDPNYDDVFAEYWQVITCYQKVYTEIGMILGAKMALELLNKDITNI